MLFIIVPRRESSLHRYLSLRFAGVEGVQVVLERRQSERRRVQRSFSVERRRADRRSPRSAAQVFGVTLVHL
jgi:hypothetical protein